MNPLAKKLLFLLGGVTLAGLVFFLSQEPKLVSTTHFISPAGKKQPSPSLESTPFNPERLVLDLKNYLATQSGVWGVAITPLTPNNGPAAEKTFGLNLDRSFPAASVMKVLVAANLINRADKKEFSLEKKIEGEALIDLMRKMINRTDNDAWYILNHFLGFKNLQEFGQDLGMKNLSVYQNTLSPTDVNFLLIAIYQNEVASANSCQLLLSFMQGTETEDRIPAAFNKEINVYHKTGTWVETGTYSDAGVIEVETPFILTFLSENASSQNQATETIKTLTEKVFQSLVSPKSSSPPQSSS